MPLSAIQALATDLPRTLDGVEGVTAVYLFGSALRDGTPTDVDLVVVYEPPLTPASAPSVTPLIEAAVGRTFRGAAHVLFFTRREAAQPGLLDKWSAVRVYSSAS